MKASPLAPIPDDERARDARNPRVRDAGWKPLSRKQKAMLCAMARTAAEVRGVPMKGEAHTEWRHDVCVAACGRRISEAQQRDWAALKAAMEVAGKKDGAALRTHVRDADNPRRVAMYKLTEELKKKGMSEGYAVSIARRQYKRELAELNASELWKIFYTVRNRKGGRRDQ